MTNHFREEKKAEGPSSRYLKIILIIFFLSVPAIFIMLDNMIYRGSAVGTNNPIISEYDSGNSYNKHWYDRFLK